MRKRKNDQNGTLVKKARGSKFPDPTSLEGAGVDSVASEPSGPVVNIGGEPEKQLVPENAGAASELSEHTLDEEIHAEDGAGVQPVARKLSAEEVAELFRTDELPAGDGTDTTSETAPPEEDDLAKLFTDNDPGIDGAVTIPPAEELNPKNGAGSNSEGAVLGDDGDEADLHISRPTVELLPEEERDRVYLLVTYNLSSDASIKLLQFLNKMRLLSESLSEQFLQFLDFVYGAHVLLGEDEILRVLSEMDVPVVRFDPWLISGVSTVSLIDLFSEDNGIFPDKVLWIFLKFLADQEKGEKPLVAPESSALKPEEPEPKAPKPERKDPAMLKPENPAPAAPGPEEPSSRARTQKASKPKRKKGIVVISSILVLLLAALAFWMLHKSSKAEVTAFTVAGIPAYYISKAGDDSIKVQVSFDTNLAEALVRVEVSPKATSGLKDSTMVNFVQGRKNFEVVAGDKKTTKIWHVVVTKSLNKEAKIKLVDFPGKTTWHADDNNITAVARPGVDITKLSPIITISEGASIDPPSGAPQDFLKGPVTYKITAQDGTTKEFVVTVKVAEPGSESRLGKWEGVCNPLFRQIFADPAYWGYKGPDNEAAMKKWSEGEAFRTAMLCGYVSSKDGSETRVVRAGVYYVLVKYDNGKKAVIEYDHGKQTDINPAADSFATAEFAGDKGNENHLQSYEYIVPAEKLSENFQTTDEVSNVAGGENTVSEVKTEAQSQSVQTVPAVGNEDAGQVESKTPSKSVSLEELPAVPVYSVNP